MAQNYRFPYMTIIDARTAQVWSEKATKPNTAGFIFYKDSTTQTDDLTDSASQAPPSTESPHVAGQHKSPHHDFSTAAQTEEPPQHLDSLSQATTAPRETLQMGEMPVYEAFGNESPRSVSSDPQPRHYDHVRALREKDATISMLKEKLLQLGRVGYRRW